MTIANTNTGATTTTTTIQIQHDTIQNIDVRSTAADPFNMTHGPEDPS